MYEKRPEEYLDEFENERLNESKLKDAKNKAGNLGNLKGQFLSLIQMVKDGINGNIKISPVDMAMLVGAIVYVISPIDAIPDFIPVVGWTDDISVVGFVLKSLNDILKKYQNNIE